MTAEGTFCTVTGVELHGPQVVCHDFRTLCNSLPSRVSPADQARRRARSIATKQRAEGGLRRYVDAVSLLYGRSQPRAKAVAAMRSDRVRAIAKSLPVSPSLWSVMALTRAAAARTMLSPGAPAGVVAAAARAVWEISKAVGIARATHAGIRGFALTFTATVVSKAGGDIARLDARLGTSAAAPIAALAAAAAIPDVDFARFGVRCRSMSKLWREIKGGVA